MIMRLQFIMHEGSGGGASSDIGPLLLEGTAGALHL